MIIVDQQNMAFPDLLIIMAQKNSGGTSLHPVRDLFRSYDIDKRGVINADEMTGECKCDIKSELDFDFSLDVGARTFPDGEAGDDADREGRLEQGLGD